MFVSFYQRQLVPPRGGAGWRLYYFSCKSKSQFRYFCRLLFTVVTLRGSHGKQE